MLLALEAASMQTGFPSFLLHAAPCLLLTSTHRAQRYSPAVDLRGDLGK